MNEERLLRLAAHLEGLPAKNFALESWAVVDDDEGPDLLEDFAILDDDDHIIGWKRASCGYSACAVGHAGSIRAFRDEGFYIALLGSDSTDAAPVYGDHMGWDAVEVFFELYNEQAWELFTSEGYPGIDPTPKDVAHKIRQFVEDFHTVLT